MARQTLTSGQVARMLSIPARTIRAYLNTGRLEAEQNPVTGRWKIGRQALDEFMRKNGLDPASLNRPLRVLVVDRDEATSQQVRRVLTGSGRTATVEWETNCAAGLITLGSQPPDVVILDAATAGDRCVQLIEAIREHERTRNVRLLVLVEPEGSEPPGARPHAWLPKPLDQGRLDDGLKRLLSRVP